jgi:SAM-dependent methyltransferase
MTLFWKIIREKKILRGPRCLEWKSIVYLPTLSEVCTDPFEFAHIGAGYCPGGKEGPYTQGKGYCGDLHNISTVIPANMFNTIICTQVFEHIERPWVAVKELYQILAPDGLLIFSVPHMYMLHTAPGIGDYYRYTVHGTKSILEQGGFCVFFVCAGTDNILVGLDTLGMHVPQVNLTKCIRPLAPTIILALATKTRNCSAYMNHGPLDIPEFR